MLAADKQALESVLNQQSLQIREKELKFFVDNFGAVAGQAAMLAGFSFSGLVSTIEENHDNTALRVAYYAVSSCALGLMILACANCTLINVLGVGLALRGPQGSMDRAVKEMAAERLTTFSIFSLGLIFFHCTAILYANLTLEVWPAVMVSVVLSIFMIAFYTNTKRIYLRLKIPDAEMQTGQVIIGGYSVAEGAHVESNPLSGKAPNDTDMQAKMEKAVMEKALELVADMKKKENAEVSQVETPPEQNKRASFNFLRSNTSKD